MRLLFLSNFYPPARPGGYTQWCYEVAEALKARGHNIGVVTSRHELEKVTGPKSQIWRPLYLDGDLNYYRPVHFFTRWRREQRENLLNLRRVIDSFEPDLVFVWGMWAMSQRLPWLAEQLMPSRVVYYLSDYWPLAADMHRNYWAEAARHRAMRLPKRTLAWLARRLMGSEESPELAFERAICVSQAVKDILVQGGLPLAQAQVIHGGSDVARFPNGAEPAAPDAPLRLLYAGQLVPHKGVHTAIEALAHLATKPNRMPVALTIVGTGHPDYEAFLRRLIDQHSLSDTVVFRGGVSRAEMPSLLRQFDVLVFPSTYEEPLARMTQEAMLSGLLVIGTTTGGSKELLVHGANSLTFAAEDSEGLADQIALAAGDRVLRERLAAAGRQTVAEKFNLDRMVDEIEAYLEQVVRQPVTSGPAVASK